MALACMGFAWPSMWEPPCWAALMNVKLGELDHAVAVFNLDFSNISVHRGRESEKDVVLQQFL
jgi:hypothetical protein